VSSVKKKSSFASLRGLTKPGAEILSGVEDTHLTNQSNKTGSTLGSMISTNRLAGAMEVPVGLVKTSPFQIRQNFNEEELQNLADDIQERGILQPLVVRVNAENSFEIIAGERRYRAAVLAGVERIPVIIREMDDAQAQLTMLIENIQRANLTPADERNYFLELQNKFNLSITDIAKMIHKSRSYVRDRIENNLVSLIQSSNVPSNEQSSQNTTAPNSELFNNVLESGELRKNSQSGGVVRQKENSKYSPAPFTRFSKAMRTTLNFLEKEPPDLATRNQLRETLEEVEQELLKLKDKLNKLDKIHENGVRELQNH
jgi:ParB/RepB/Spo0J family partition protein